MKSIFSKSHYGLTSGVALWLSVIHFSGWTAEHNTSANVVENLNHSLDEYSLKHTVNFNNIAVTEVIRFVSKITGSNFIFLDSDVNFNVTIVSEEPMSIKNITSALIQILRVHGLKLLEQDNNFVITKSSSDVNQISAIVSPDLPGSETTQAPIITKVFRIKNANLSTLITIIKPMVSGSSLIEMVPQTHQLIVTDITTNLDKISSLITLLDTPLSNLEIESYTIKNIASDQVISLAEKILAPFTGGNPLFLIPQKETNTIFIVSTPYLIERTMSVLEDLDTPGKALIAGEASLSTYVYKIENQTPESLLSDLALIQNQIPTGTDPNLEQAIASSKYIPSAGSIVFITDAHTWDRLKVLLSSIDTVPNPVGKVTFWIYKTKNDNPKQLISALKQLSSGLQDKSLQDTIGSMQWIPETGSLVFTGPEHSILKLQEIIPSLDLSAPQVEPKIYVYKIQHTSEAQISSVLKQITPTLGDANFTAAVAGMQWVKGSNSLIFKTPPETIKQLEQILPSIDVATPELQLYVYKTTKAQKAQMAAALDLIADTTQDSSLAAAIQNMQWMADSTTLIFNAPRTTIEKLQSLLPSLDVVKLQAPQTEMYLYKVHNAPSDKIISSLSQIQSTLQDKDLIDALKTLQWISDSHTFVFHGTPDAIAQLKQILPMIDVKAEVELYTYKVQKASEEQVSNALEGLASNSKDKEFIQAVKTMQVLVDSHTLVFNTNSAVIAKLQSLLPTLDVAKSPALHMYKVKAAPSAKINSTLDQLAKTSQNKDLVDAINNRQWMTDTQTFIFHGKDEAIAELKQILQAIDIESSHLELYVYKIHKAPDADVIAGLEKIAHNSQDKNLAAAIDTMQWVQSSHSIIFNATPEAVTKLKSLIPTLDTSTSDMFLYPVKEASKDAITASLNQIMETSSDKELVNAIASLKWMNDNKTCIFHGTQNAIDELKKILPSIDTPSTLSLYVYKVEHAKESDIEEALRQTSQTLQNKEFTAAIQTMKWMQDSHSLVFNATPSTLVILKTLLPSLDASESSLRQLHLYKIEKAPEPQIAAGLAQIKQSTQDRELIFAIDHMQWIQKSNTLAFNTTNTTFAKLKEILSSLDVHQELYVYKIQYASEEQIENTLKQMASKSQDNEFILAIQTMQWIPDTKTLVFNTSPAIVTRLQSLLPTLDVSPHRKVYLYKSQPGAEDRIKETLSQIAESSKNKDFMDVVNSLQWVDSTKTFIFHGTEDAIAELKQILPTIDLTSPGSQMYVYTVTQAPEDQIAIALDQTSQTMQNKDFTAAIKTMRWMPDTHNLVFNSTPAVIATLQTLLPKLDVLSAPKRQLYLYKIKSSAEKQIVSSLEQIEDTTQDKELAFAIDNMQWIEKSGTLAFNTTPDTIATLQSLLPSLDVPGGDVKLYMYKVKTASQEHIDKALSQIADSLEDPNLVPILDSRKWVAENHTYIFHGTAESISQLEKILALIDTIQDSDTQLYFYPIKIASEPQIEEGLTQASLTANNKDFTAAIESMQWLKNSNTLVFNTTPTIIAKLQSLLSTLDNTAHASQMYIYKPKNAKEAEILSSLSQMANTVQDPDLANTLKNVQWMESTKTLVFHGTRETITKLSEILPTLDVENPSLQMYMYKTQNPNPSSLTTTLGQMALNIQDKDLVNAINSMKWIPDTKTFLFHGTPSAIAKLEKILPTIETTTPAPNQIYIYTVQHLSEAKILSALELMSEKIQDPDFISAIENVQWIEGSHHLVFNTTPAVIERLKAVLPSIDILAPQMYMYKVQTASPDQITASLQKMALTLQDKDLSNAIQGMKWIEESHTFVFNGTPAAIAQLQNILPSLDSTALSSKAQFLIYNPQNQKGEDLQETLEELAQNLKKSGLENSNLTTALDSMKWVPSSNSLVFTGDAASLDKIKGILATTDIPSPQAATVGVFVYKPIYASEYQLQNALTQFAQKLDPSNASDALLAQAIYQMNFTKANGSFTFKADPATLARLKTTLNFLDSAQGLATIKTTHFSLYKLQYVSGDVIIKNLRTLSDTLPDNDLNSASVIKAIQDLQWVKENNSLMITGSPYVVDQIKGFIAEFDTASAVNKAPLSQGDFLIYKPLNKSPEALSQALSNLAKDVGDSSFVNPDLLKTLQTIRIISSTQSLIFTGTPDILSKVKSLASSLDVKGLDETLIQSLGDTTFLIYKIKQAPHEDLIRSLQTFASQLSQSDVADQTLAKSLSSVSWIQETNSLMFTGPSETLRKVEALADKFDLGTLLPAQPPRETPATFIVYTPKAQKGNDLIGVLHEFMQNLIHSGISDPGLFDTISHLRFIDKTNSLIISGDAGSIQKIQELLVKFDIPSLDNGKPQVDASNFLIYKLQYHQGADILLALKKVAISLDKSAPDANQALIDAIDSLQWLEVTNSLLVTGEPGILAKLRHLITNLDVPLRQVFIEVLVVETSLFNSQNFGLQWGSQFQYLNKTIGTMGNFPTVTNSQINPSGNQFPGTLNLANPLSNVTNLVTPVAGNPLLSPTALPFSTGFDLGVIGDILFHKGQSFISLGGLLNALQVDNDSTVIMNPKLITQDGHTSSIFVGQNIPFVGSFISNTASNTVQSSNIEYRDVGVNLVITPTLGTNNVITLDISQDISEQSPNTTSVQGSQVTGIQTSHTTMNTRVHVPDRHFLVLSGMIQDRKNHFRSSIPCLGGLPVIGALFAENDRTNSKSNVIIFLRPFIIDSFKDYDLLTADEEDLFKSQAGLQDLKEEFDAGPEMIKNLHND